MLFFNIVPSFSDYTNKLCPDYAGECQNSPRRGHFRTFYFR